MLNHVDERRSAAIHDGQLRTPTLHRAVIDTHAVEGRDQMLDRGQARILVAKSGCQSRVDNPLRPRGKPHRLGQIGSKQQDPGASGRRAQHEVHGLPRVQPGPRTLNSRRERVLDRSQIDNPSTSLATCSLTRGEGHEQRTCQARTIPELFSQRHSYSPGFYGKLGWRSAAFGHRRATRVRLEADSSGDVSITA